MEPYNSQELHSRRPRFTELASLVREFLLWRLQDTSLAQSTSAQLLNVLGSCDTITYDEEGAAEAYALLHFLDRYHRFQMTLDHLHARRAMPVRKRVLDILDVGTGPGAAMFALSDFYADLLKADHAMPPRGGHPRFRIDYVERSQRFRSWLHHFTEYANASCPDGVPWYVPYHHGTFTDFNDLPLDEVRTFYDWDDDGAPNAQRITVRHRYDLVVLSNFLTSAEQVSKHAADLLRCARYLRNNGVLLIVGARDISPKYKAVYQALTDLFAQGNYGNWKYVAKLFPIDIQPNVLSYSWADAYGVQLKTIMTDVVSRIASTTGTAIPAVFTKKLNQTTRPDFNRAIEWQVMAYRKWSRLRQKK